MTDERRLEAVIVAYNAAADKFIKKCEEGRAKSRTTYAELKAARALARELEVSKPC